LIEKKMSDPSSSSSNTAEVVPAASTFKLLNMQTVVAWAWDISNDTCAICRNSIQDLCINCAADPVLNESAGCDLAWGACNHAFHFHCISKWLKTRQVCPLDNKEWTYQKYGGSSSS
jgi:RING-box protein 1